MTERRSSSTALGVATLRAVHQLIDEEPKILDDPVSLQLLDPHILDQLQTNSHKFQTPMMNRLRSHIVTRSRYAEDRLAEAVHRGIRQYVILGAGLDTFAYRQPLWAQGLRIFEVDHPASQRSKRERLGLAGIPVPPNVEFVAIDFELVSLDEGLRGSSFDPGKPAFLSWLGVMMYLSAEAIDKVFHFVASLPRSSEMAFTFAGSDSFLEEGSAERSTLAALVSALGEPWRTRVEPDLLVRKLRGFGFSNVSFLTPSEIEERYIRGRRDGLRAPRRVGMASAAV